MNRVLRWLLVGLLVVGCVTSSFFQTVSSGSTMPTSALGSSVSISVTQPVDFSQHFRDLGVEGSILIYDLTNDRTYQHNPQR